MTGNTKVIYVSTILYKVFIKIKPQTRKQKKKTLHDANL